jgi:hypothetical protein
MAAVGRRGGTDDRPNRRRKPVHIRATEAVAQTSTLRAHLNSRAKIASPRGTTTTLVPGMGTTRRATPNVRTRKPAAAVATLRITSAIERLLLFAGSRLRVFIVKAMYCLLTRHDVTVLSLIVTVPGETGVVLPIYA